MLSNRLRHRITIQELVEVQDTNTGAVVRSWETFIADDGTIMDAVPAEVLTGPGRTAEYVSSGTTLSEAVCRINIRWFPGLTEKMRVLWDGAIFNISAVDTDVTARQEYRMRCVSGVSDGQ